MAGSPVKAVLDTSIYIPFINQGIAFPPIDLRLGKSMLYMSAVVIEELYAGVSDRFSTKLLDRLYKTFEDLGRLIVPNGTDWQRTGRVIAKLGQKYGFEGRFLASIQNDILIALSARRVGAILVTHNTRDFLRIKEFVDFKVYG